MTHLIEHSRDSELRYTWMFKQAPDFDINIILGKRDNEIANNDGATALMRLKKQVLDTGKPVNATILFPVKEKTVSYHILAQPISDQQGNITGVSTCASECICEQTLTE